MELMAGWLDVPLWVMLLTFVLVLISVDYLWTFSEFEKRGIPGPKPWPVVGNVRSILKLGFPFADMQWRKEFGNFYGFYRGRVPVLVVHDKKMLQSIMIKDFSSFCDRESGQAVNKPMDKGVFFLDGHEWRDVRNLMSPTFTSGKLKKMFGLVNECGVQLGDNFVDYAKGGTNVVANDLYGAFTMDVIASTAFGLKVDSQRNLDSDFIKHMKCIFKFNVNIMRLLAVFYPPLLKLFKHFVSGIWPDESVLFFEDIIKETVKKRRQDGEKRVDFLQLLMDAEGEGATSNVTPGVIPDNNTAANFKRVIKKRLTTDELVAQSFLFYIAGYHTTATTLQYLSYNFALNPECQQKAYQEIRDIIGDTDPTYDSISRLTYLDQCVQETLRLHPPVTFMSRVATADTKLGKYPIPKGSIISLPYYGIHHNPEYYPNPEVYDPDRFAPESKDKRRQILFTPFGNGPRICIGSRLALLEAKVAMVHVLRNVSVEKCDETQVPLSFFPPSPLLIPTTPIKVGVTLR